MKKYKFIMIAFFFSFLFNMGIHQFDNKYTYNDREAKCGIVDFSSSSKMHFLTSEWEIYNGQLLTPQMIETKQYTPTRYINIGEFGGFEMGNPNQETHGQATYRLRIYDQANRIMTMQLPEIFSAYRLYINGELLYQSGNPTKENYQPKILTTAITFKTQDCNEIVIQVSDYSHYYSGMIYPIAYGTNQQVNIYETFQTLVKGIQSFLPLIMFIVCIFSYLFAGRHSQDGYFAIICLSYLSHVLYTIVHLLVNSSSFVWYRIEDLSYYALIYFICIFTLERYNQKISKRLMIGGFVFMIISLLIPSLLIPSSQSMIYILGYIGKLWKIILSLIMIYIILKNTRDNVDDQLKKITYFVIFFIVSIHMDNMFWYEPVYLGWGSEISGLALISYFSVIMVNEKINLYHENKALSQEEKNMKEYIYDVAHDLKAPAASLYGYVELLNSGIAKKQNKEDYFLKQIAKKVEILSERIALLQKLDIERISLNKEEVSIQSLIESLKDKYQILLKKKELSIQIKGDDFIINVDREKIIICLENLLLNAIEHAYVHTNIFFELGEDDWGYQVSISNLGKMVSQEEINHFFERGYTTGGENHSGLGLSICQKIMNAHMGTISVKNKKETITFIMRFIKK